MCDNGYKLHPEGEPRRNEVGLFFAFVALLLFLGGR